MVDAGGVYDRVAVAWPVRACDGDDAYTPDPAVFVVNDDHEPITTVYRPAGGRVAVSHACKYAFARAVVTVVVAGVNCARGHDRASTGPVGPDTVAVTRSGVSWLVTRYAFATASAHAPTVCAV